MDRGKSTFKKSFFNSTIAASLLMAGTQSAFAQQSDGSFITNSLSGKCIDVAGAPGQNTGAKLQLWDCESSGFNPANNSVTDQKWVLTPEGFIKNSLSGKCIDVAGAPGQAHGSPLSLWDCELSGINPTNGSPTDQKWELTSGGFIKNSLSGRCLDVSGVPGRNNGTRLTLANCENTSNTDQKWSFTNSPSTKNFPLRGAQFTELGDHRRMESNITVSNNGRIDGVTRIWTAHKWVGFTGAVGVAITDSAGNVLHVIQPKSYGVDCRRCPGPSDRTQQWSDSIPSNVLSQVGGYAIIHTTNPTDRLSSWLRRTKEAVSEIKSIYKEFGN